MRKLFAILLMLMLAIGETGAVSVHARISKSKIGVGEVFHIIVNVEGTQESPSVPKTVKGAKILYHWQIKTESSFSMENGRTSSSVKGEYTLTLRAMEKGSYSFGPVIVGGKKSNVVNYSIVEGKTPSQPQPQASPDPAGGAAQPQQSGPRFIGKGDDNLFMVASLSKSSAYEQEALVYTVKLYSSYSGIRFLGATESPKFDGFVLEDANPKIESLHYETYKGKSYACAVVARYIIFPQMKGKLRIVGNKYTVTVESRSNYYDPYFQHMSFGRAIQLSVQPNDLVVDVRPLPQPQPTGFSGGVGKFTLSAQLPNSHLATNQGAQIIYTIKGSGNIKYVTMPDLNTLYPPELEVYTPTSTVSAGVSGSTVAGQVKFDYSIMPQEPGKYRIPAVNLIYFNPESGRYETARCQGFSVDVVKGKASKSQTRRNLRLDSELMSYSAPLEKEHHPFAGSLPYWLCYIIPFLAVAILIPLRFRWMRIHADTVSLAARRANKLAARKLRKAAACLKANDRERFFDEILAALWGYAADKLRMPGSELNRDNVRGKLAANGVPDDEIDRFLNLIDQSEFAKYATGVVSMKDTYLLASEIIKNIDNSFKPSAS